MGSGFFHRQPTHEISETFLSFLPGEQRLLVRTRDEIVHDELVHGLSRGLVAQGAQGILARLASGSSSVGIAAHHEEGSGSLEL